MNKSFCLLYFLILNFYCIFAQCAENLASSYESAPFQKVETLEDNLLFQEVYCKFDASRQAFSFFDEDGNHAILEYDPGQNELKVIDSNGWQTIYYLDELGAVFKVELIDDFGSLFKAIFINENSYSAKNALKGKQEDSLSEMEKNSSIKISEIGVRLFDVFNNLNEYINEHLSFEYNFREKIEEPLLFIFSKDTLTLFGFYRDQKEAGVIGRGEISDKARITFINGILNAKYYLVETVEMISQLHGDNNVHYIFRPTEGWTWDIVKSTLVKFGWISPQAKHLAKYWKKMIAEMGGVHAGGTIVHYAHSIGSVDTYLARTLLSDEELKMIKVYTFGSPFLYGPCGFQSITNYVSKGDGVSLLDPIRYIHTLLKPVEHVAFLPGSWSVPLIDHQLNFPAYQSTLENLGQQFLIDYSSGSVSPHSKSRASL